MEHIFTQSNFEKEVLQSRIPVLVDFWAPWCGPCHAMAPVIETLASEIDSTKAIIGKVNVDEQGAIAAQYNIMSIPTFLIFKNGQVVDQMVGSLTKAQLKERILKYV